MTGTDQPSLSAALMQAKPRSAAEALRLYKPYYEDLLRLNSSKREFIAKRDAPEQVFRWLVELDCGCVTDALTMGHRAAHVPMDELYPSNCVFDRFLENGKSGASKQNVLLFAYGVSWEYSNWSKGYAWCAGHGDDLPMRDIVAWLERKERPSFYSKDSGKELGPYAVWTVKLSCGHYDYHAISGIDWQPEQGYAERADVVMKIRDRLASQDLDEKARNQLEWALAFQGSEPQAKDGCPYCVYMRRIVGCRPIGPLTKPKPPSRPKEPPQPPSRRTLTSLLNATEANVLKLREQLAQAELEAARLREDRDKASD
jgi:hypothetical protein